MTHEEAVKEASGAVRAQATHLDVGWCDNIIAALSDLLAAEKKWRALYDKAWQECESGRIWVADQKTHEGAMYATYGEYSPEYQSARAAHDAARREAGIE